MFLSSFSISTSIPNVVNESKMLRLKKFHYEILKAENDDETFLLMLCGILFSAYAWRADDKSQRAQFPLIKIQWASLVVHYRKPHQSCVQISAVLHIWTGFQSIMVVQKPSSRCGTALWCRVRSDSNLYPVRHHSIWNIWFIDESCRFVTTFIGLNKSWLMFSEHSDKKECLVVKNWISFTF